MPVGARQLLIFCLVAAFAMQTWLVYSDPIGSRDTLSPLAAEGQAVWRERNCQSCHQLFGYGGFLGPDLTNSIHTLSSERLESVLTVGSGQMPAFHLGLEERTALAAFLVELDATGVSQPRLGEVVPPTELFAQFVEAAEASEPLPEEVGRGWQLVRDQSCIGCHLPNLQSLHLSMDLTLMSGTVEHARLFEVLRDGIPGKAMPRLAMSAEDSADVLAFLQWLSERGPELRSRFENLATSGELTLSGLPWYEYE